MEDALEATPVPVPEGLTLDWAGGLEAGISAEAEGIAGPSEPGRLATSVASPELAVDAGIAAG